MDATRRRFLKGSGAAVGALATLSSDSARAAQPKGGPSNMVGACGLACSACPLMQAGKCKGCGPANTSSADVAAAKAKCPVFSCARMKGIAHCGTACKKFTECGKLIGKPYSKEFMATLKTRLG